MYQAQHYAEGENGGNSKTAMVLSIAVCVFILFALGILAWALPQPTYSEQERRDLEQMPKFTAESFFKGEYTAKIELSYADTFAFRDQFVKAKSLIEEMRGIQDGGTLHGKLPSNNGDGESEPSSKTETLPENNTSSPELPDTNQSGSSSENQSEASSSEPEQPEEPDDGEIGETIEGIFVYKGMGFELFGGSKKASEYYASVINKYREALPSSVNVYNMVVPKHAEFALPKKYKSLSNSEKDAIDDIYSRLEEGVTAVDAYSVLSEHSKEYIYFNTDHHWTGLGAYYAYTAFTEAAGLPHYEYSDYTKHTIENFLGTLYSDTMDSKMANNPDSVEWCEFPVENQTWQYKKGDLENYYSTTVMASYAKGAYSYGVYLGGDYPLTIVKTSGVDNGRKCLIIKESYGNALSTYIASAFDETYIVDERYYDGNIVDLITERGITDVLIINNISASNTNYHIANIESLLTQKYSGTIKYPF